MSVAILFALLLSGCLGWERPDSLGGKRIVEFTNSSGVSVDCDWTGDGQRKWPSQQLPNNGRQHHDGPVADGIVLTWLDANRQPVVSIPGIRHVLSNGTLSFSPYRGDAYRPDVHSAEYRCLASTASGALLSPPIIIRSAVIGVLQVYASDAYTLPGNSAVLPCLVLPSDQAWAVEVTHWTVGSNHLVDSHLIPQPGSKYVIIDGHLHVSDVTAEDTRLSYKCHARHRFQQGTRPSSSSSPPAKILFSHETNTRQQLEQLQPLPMGPQLVGVHQQTSLRIRHARLGQDDVYMTCTVMAYPPAKIRWVKISAANGAAAALVPDGRRVIIGGDWLRLGQPNGEDAGRYRCQAANSQGQIEAEFRLDVHGPLRARLEPQRQVVGVGQPVEFTCNVSGSTRAQATSVRWARNGLDISPDGGRFFFPQPNVMRINQAVLADAGMYQCFVRFETALAGSQASAELVVRDFPTRLTDVFNEQMVYPGRPVYLHCSASGSPAPSIVWTVDSFPVPYTSGRVSAWSHQLDENGIKSYLNISASEVEDGGLYCCSIQNQLDNQPDASKSTTHHCARLNVYGIASIRWAGNKTAVANQDYYLHCPFAGYPIQSVNWQRGGHILRETEKYKAFTNGTLRISTMDPAQDGGEYTCLVRGSASSTAKKALYVDIIRPPVIEPFGFPTQVQDGGRAQVTCSISAGDLPIQVSWMRDGRPISGHLNVEMQTGEFHSLLIFKKLRGEHSGVYTCTARNLAATATHSATLLVQVPPRWIVEPQDVSLLENYPATIPCQVHGMPAPNLRWFRIEGDNSIAIHASGKISLLADGSLRFSRMAKSDEGLFQCRAGNNIGNPLSKTVRISVNAPAKVRIHASGAILPTGSETLLRCEVSGDQPLTVHWRRFDQLVDQMDRFQLTLTSSPSHGQFLDLNISRVEAEDGGLYICQAANVYGSDAADIRLIVQELPRAPGQLQLTSVQSRSAELQWMDEEVDPLLEYRVQLTRPGTGWTFNHTIEAGRSVITLPHLQPFTTYQVQVNAINSAGIGPSSSPLEFQTHEEAPSGAVRHVQAEPKTSRTAIVSWLPPNEETWNGKLVTFTVTCLENGNGQVVQRSVAYPRDSRTVRRVQVTVDDLRPATGYAVTVRALNRVGAGPESETVALNTPEAPPSSAPINLQCVSLSSDAIQLTWAQPAPAHHHGHLQGFRIFYKMMPSIGKQIFMSDDVSSFRPESKRVGNVLESVLYGLQAFQNYSIQISALNRAGAGPLSVPAVCQTDEKVPSVVQELKAASISGSSVLIVWRKPIPSSGRIAHYVIQVKDSVTQETKKFLQQETDKVLDYKIGQLVENRLYEITVTAKGRTGEGRPSRAITLAPISKSGAKILEFSRTIFVEEQQADIVLTCPTAGTLPVEKSWTFSGQPLDVFPHLNYRWEKDGALHLLDVDRNSEGDYGCTARNQHGRDSVVFTLNLLRPPEMPQLSVTPTSTSSIRLWWSKPSGSSSKLPVLEYAVLFRPAYTGTAIQEKIVDGNEDGTVLDGLLCGTQYELQVQARNQIGPGLKSPILRAMTRGSGPTLPEVSSLFGFSAGLPATLFLHLDHWPTGGCRISSLQVEKRGPLSLIGSDPSGWNALASNLNPDEQPMLKMSDFIHDETYQLKLTAASDAGIQTVSYSIRRTRRKAENGSIFDVVPMMSTSGQTISYESLIVIASMSISGMMLLFSLVAISYVIHKRKQYQANAAAAASNKSEYSLRTVAEQLEADHQFQQGRSLPRSNGIGGSNYSLRKQVETTTVDYDDDDITPYATFTLKPISGMDTTRSLMSVPSVRGPDSHSSNSIEADVYGHHGHHPTLPCMTMQPPPLLSHPAHVYRHLNRSPVPPYRPSCESTSDSIYDETAYSTKNHQRPPSGSMGRSSARKSQQQQQPPPQQQQHHQRSVGVNSHPRTTARTTTTALHVFQHQDGEDDVNKFRF